MKNEADENLKVKFSILLIFHVTIKKDMIEYSACADSLKKY